MNPQEMSRQDDFLIGAWHVQPGLLRLQGPDATVDLEPRAMSVLVVLKEHAGQVVSRQRLHELAWADATVSDETINRTIFDLRQGLGDRASDPRFIETIRKVGYRLIAPVEPVPTPTAARPRPETGRRRLGWLLVALAIGGVSAAITAGFSKPPSTTTTTEPPRHRQLTSYPGYETTPAVSPDGRRLAFAWDGGHAGNVDIYWRDLDDSRPPARLTDDPRRDDGPAFSPDGQQLAFVRSDAESCRLMVADLPTTARRSTVPPRPTDVGTCREASISPPSWSADGRALIFADRDTPDEPFRLRRLDLGTGETSTLSAPPFGSLGDLYPSLSPSGRRLAFVRASAKSTISTYLSPAIGDLWVLDLDASAGRGDSPPPRRLTQDNRVVAGLTWTTDDDALIYASRRDGRGYALWRVAADGGEPSVLSAPRGLLRFPQRVDRHRVAYERWEGRTDLWSVPLDPSTLRTGRRIQGSTRSDLNPTWSPSGDRLAFTSERSGNYEIWTSLPDGRDAAQLTDFVEGPAESPAWSPDGRWIAFEANRDGHSHLYRVAAAGGGEVQQLTDTSFDDRSPAWSLDGRRLLFGSNRSGSWQLWQLDLDSGRTLQRTRSGAFRGRESAHTEPPTLLYAKRDRGGIWRADSSGDEHLVAELAPEHWGNWDVVDGVLFTVELDGGSTRIHSLDLATGETRIAGIVDGWISRETPNLTVAADRSSILMARFTDLAADLMLVDMR